MDEDAQARNRYFVIQALRIGGVGIVLVGLLILRGKIAADPLVGYALLAMGLLDVFLVPLVLARKWRTQRSIDDPQDRE